jgi:hypothetical protein
MSEYVKYQIDTGNFIFFDKNEQGFEFSLYR